MNFRLANKRIFYGWVVLAACLAMYSASAGIRLSFGVFFKPLEAEFACTRAVTSGVFSAYLIVCGVVGIAGGWALDRYGPRKVVIITGLLTTLGLFLTSLAQTAWHVFVSYSCLVAMGTGANYVIVMALVSRWFFEMRGLALGIVSCGAGIGMVVVPPIAESIISSYDWRTSYMALAVIALIVVIPCALLLRRGPGERVTSGSVPASDATNSGTSHKRQYYADESQPGLMEALRTLNFWLLLSMLFLWACCSFIILAHVVRHGIDLGVATLEAATILTVIGAASIPGRLAMGRLSDTWGSKRVSFMSVLILMGAMSWLLWASDLWMLYLFAALFGLSFGASSPLMTALTGDAFGTRNLGIILGALQTGWSAGCAFGPVLAGHIYDVNGSYTPAFLLGIGISAVAALLILSLRIPGHRNRTDT